MKAATPDAGLQQIANWHTLFVSGHTARLNEADIAPDVRVGELAEMTRLAAAIRARLESDYRLNRSRR